MLVLVVLTAFMLIATLARGEARAAAARDLTLEADRYRAAVERCNTEK